MNNLARPLAAAIAALSVLALPIAAQAGTLKEKAARQLEELLEGRVAGEPQDCIFLPARDNHMRVLHGTALVFGRGKTIYVNYTEHPDSLDRSDIFAFRRASLNLCDIDTATTSDAGGYTGNVMLTKFIPYTRE